MTIFGAGFSVPFVYGGSASSFHNREDSFLPDDLSRSFVFSLENQEEYPAKRQKTTHPLPSLKYLVSQLKAHKEEIGVPYTNAQIAHYLHSKGIVKIGDPAYDSGLFPTALLIEWVQTDKGNHLSEEARGKSLNYFLKKQLELCQVAYQSYERARDAYEKVSPFDIKNRMIVSYGNKLFSLPRIQEMLEEGLRVMMHVVHNQCVDRTFERIDASINAALYAILRDLSQVVVELSENCIKPHSKRLPLTFPKSLPELTYAINFLGDFLNSMKDQCEYTDEVIGAYLYFAQPSFRSDSEERCDLMKTFFLPIVTQTGAVGFNTFLYAISKGFTPLASALGALCLVHDGIYSKWHIQFMHHDFFHSQDVYGSQIIEYPLWDFVQKAYALVIEAPGDTDAEQVQKKLDILVLFSLFYEVADCFPRGEIFLEGEENYSRSFRPYTFFQLLMRKYDSWLNAVDLARFLNNFGAEILIPRKDDQEQEKASSLKMAQFLTHYFQNFYARYKHRLDWRLLLRVFPNLLDFRMLERREDE